MCDKMEAVAYIANKREINDGLFEEAYPYNFGQIRVVLGRKKSLLRSVRLNVVSRAAEGTFEIPRNRRYGPVTKVQYNNGCDDLARFLICALIYFNDKDVSRYLTLENYIHGRNTSSFLNPDLKMKIPHKLPPDQPFKIKMMLKGTGEEDGIMYALMRVDGAVKGEFLYAYTPQARAAL